MVDISLIIASDLKSKGQNEVLKLTVNTKQTTEVIAADIVC